MQLPHKRANIVLVMKLRNLVIGFGTVLSFAACQPKDCPVVQCPEQPIPVALKDCSAQLQGLIQGNKSHIRGLQVGMPLSAVNEADSNFVSKTSFYTSFTPDLDENYWLQIDYYYNENNIIDKVEAEVIPGGLTSQENAILVDSLYFEMRQYLSGRFGNSVTNPDYQLVWNQVDTADKSLTIFSLDYEVPEEDFSIYTNPTSGEVDTIANPPTVKYTVKFLE